MATAQALYTQNSSQNGLTVAAAWPVTTSQGITGPGLDLMHIGLANGNATVVVVDPNGVVLSSAAGLVLTSVAVVGALTTYNGTITGGAANGLVGKFLNIFGFTNAGNNVINSVIVSSSATTIVVATSSQINETKAAQALPFFPGGTRIGRFLTRLTSAATVAQIFADAFSNPSNLDIIQVINPGGNIHYNLTFQGVAVGS